MTPTTPVLIGDRVRVSPPPRGSQDVWEGTVEEISSVTGMVHVRRPADNGRWGEWVQLDRITVLR